MNYKKDSIYLGITGAAGAGKDTVADMLQKHFPVQRYAFADPIKVIVHGAFNGAFTYEDRSFKELVQPFTVCEYDLAAYCGRNYVKLYNILKEFDNFKGVASQLWFDSSWRQLYQVVGTDWARTHISQTYWIDQAPTESCIITDVRGYGDDPENVNAEADFIIRNGGMIIEVVDPRKEDKKVREHSSEIGIDRDRISYTIVNDGTLEELEEKVKNFINEKLLIGGLC